MAKDPAFLFYSADFYMGTVGMTDAQVGQYIRLLCLQHQQGALTEQMMKTVMEGKLDPAVMAKFALNEDGMYVNKRLCEETQRRQNYIESRRKNRTRSTPVNDISKTHDEDMNNICESHDEHMETETIYSNNNINSNTNNNINNNITKGDTGTKKPTIEARFNEIWTLYPKKQGKAAAFNAYKRAIKSGVTDEEITKGVQAYIAYIQHKRIDAQYIKQGGTYFNQQAWDDDYITDSDLNCTEAGSVLYD